MASKTIPGMENWFNPEAFKPFMGGSSAMNFDEFMESHRRNMEAFTSAGQAASDYTKTIAQAQQKYFRDTMEDMTQFWRNWMSTGSSWQDKLDIQNQATREGMSKAMAHSQEMAKLLQKSQEEISRSINDRMSETFTEAQKMAKRTTEAATKTKQIQLYLVELYLKVQAKKYPGSFSLIVMQEG